MGLWSTITPMRALPSACRTLRSRETQYTVTNPIGYRQVLSACDWLSAHYSPYESWGVVGCSSAKCHIFSTAREYEKPSIDTSVIVSDTVLYCRVLTVVHVSTRYRWCLSKGFKLYDEYLIWIHDISRISPHNCERKQKSVYLLPVHTVYTLGVYYYYIYRITEEGPGQRMKALTPLKYIKTNCCEFCKEH